MGTIVPGKPLPKHTKVKYDECYAEIILERLYPERYTNLSLSDKPDLRNEDNTIGIEITSAISQNIRETRSLWCDLVNDTTVNSKKSKERMSQLGVPYEVGIQCWPGMVYPTGNFEQSPYIDIIDSISTKINKLNSGKYESLNRYDLFVETELFIQEDFLNIIFDRVQAINVMPKRFTFLYIYFINRIVSFDLFAKRYEIRRIDSEQFDIAIEARNLVERLEKE